MMAVLKVSVKEDIDKQVSVTVRLYGPNTEYVINREREILVISLICVYDKSLPLVFCSVSLVS